MSSPPQLASAGGMRTANLTVVFVAMDDFAERMASLSYLEQAALAAVFEALTVPVAKKYGGRKVKTIQESLLFTFPSPTAALKAAAAMQDRAGRYTGLVPDELAVKLRVGASSGEVRVFGNDVYGEPVNLAARVKALSGSGEVLLTSGVQLSMNRAEVATEPVGRKSFKGVPEAVEVYRLSCTAGCEDTYGGVALDVLGLPALDAGDARALASGRLAWRIHRLTRSLRRRPARSGAVPRQAVEAADALNGETAQNRAGPAEAAKKLAEGFRTLAALAGRNVKLIGAAAGVLVLASILFLALRGVGVGGTAEPLDPEIARELLPELEERVAAAPEDMAARASLAHALTRDGRTEAALSHYSRVAEADRGSLGRVHIEDLVQLLSIMGEATGDAESALLRVGRPAVGPLQEVWEREDAARYHRRRAGQVLVALGHEVDLVPIWISTLDSDRCNARELAARELGRLGDPRAVTPLQRASREGCLRGRNAARQALATLE